MHKQSLLGSQYSYLHAFMKLVPKPECNTQFIVSRHLNLKLFVCAKKKDDIIEPYLKFFRKTITCM